MSIKAFNPTQLRTEISKEIEEYWNQVQKKEITKEDMEVLIAKVLFEREILFNEIDILKEAHNKCTRKYDLNEHTLNLLIKEIDEMLYNDFYNLSKKLNYNPGEVLTSLMEDFVLKFDGVFPEFSADSLRKLMKRQPEISINHQDQLTITNKDLLDLTETNLKINFNNIDTLEFVNVDLKTFKDFVSSINHCHLVRVPQTIPKLLLYTKCHQCSYFEFFEDDQLKLDKKKIEYAIEANRVVEDWKNGS
ncbi:MAG: hypothetical protein JSW11_02730 [Candidatus Heimdallarchaeota archaeon]|nr:MAG: hypothetical protein JSW11_02730 [Candidatus Heimdallarchaeota archaeon]